MIAALAAAACAASPSHATSVLTTGGATVGVYNQSDTSTFTTVSTSFVLLTQIKVKVRSPTKLVTARFSGDSGCRGSVAEGEGFCTVRLVARNASTLVDTPLNPAGTFSVFEPSDNQDVESYEPRMLEGSVRLPTGTYMVRTEGKTNDPALTFTLFNWNLHVEVAE